MFLVCNDLWLVLRLGQTSSYNSGSRYHHLVILILTCIDDQKKDPNVHQSNCPSIRHPASTHLSFESLFLSSVCPSIRMSINPPVHPPVSVILALHRICELSSQLADMQQAMTNSERKQQLLEDLANKLRQLSLDDVNVDDDVNEVDGELEDDGITLDLVSILEQTRIDHPVAIAV